jgi:hypothetical protein
MQHENPKKQGGGHLSEDPLEVENPKNPQTLRSREEGTSMKTPWRLKTPGSLKP